MNAPRDPIEILLVEDNPGDVELTERALRAGEISNHLTVASSGADALAHLRRVSGEAVSRTQLILLDLNLPDMSGFDLLAVAQSRPPAAPHPGRRDDLLRIRSRRRAQLRPAGLRLRHQTRIVVGRKSR